MNTSKKPVQEFNPKAVVFLLFFAVASFFFAHTASLISRDYLHLVLPSVASLRSVLVLVIAILLVAVSAGLTAVLVRPFWLASAGFFVSAGFILPALGPSKTAISLTLAYFVLGLLYAFSLQRKLANQITFSLSPLSQTQKNFLLMLVVVVSAGVALGYMDDAVRRNFVLPPEVRTTVNDFVNAKAQALVESQKIPEEQKRMAVSKSKEEVAKMWASLSAQLKPEFRPVIALVLGLSAFALLQLIFVLISWVPLFVLEMLFPLFKITGLTHTVTETVEVERVVL